MAKRQNYNPEVTSLPFGLSSSHSDSGQVDHTHLAVTKLYNLVSAKQPGADPAIGKPGCRLPHRAWLLHTKFGQLTLRKITKIVAIRCKILRLKCTKFNFGWAPPDSATGVYSPP